MVGWVLVAGTLTIACLAWKMDVIMLGAIFPMSARALRPMISTADPQPTTILNMHGHTSIRWIPVPAGVKSMGFGTWVWEGRQCATATIHMFQTNMLEVLSEMQQNHNTAAIVARDAESGY
jgi:hypothetical protein